MYVPSDGAHGAIPTLILGMVLTTLLQTGKN